MRRLLPALLLASLLVPSAASAGVYLGGRLGLAIPGGEVDKGDKLADNVDWTVPIQLEAGFRGERASLGGYLRIAPGKLDSNVKNGCDSLGVSCSILDLAIGAQADLHFASGNAGPWAGGFIGYEQLQYSAAAGSSKLTAKAKGWELGAEGGIDFAWGVLTLGPWASIGFGQFTSTTLESGGSSSSQSIADKAVHTWIQLGIRGAFAF